MIQYARPSVDNLVNNLPPVLKSSRQFLAWNLERGDKKVPLRDDGSSWGSHKDRSCWRKFDDAIDLVDRGKAFGLGLVLPSQEVADAFPELNLITDLVAIDGDAKRSPGVTPFDIPENIWSYIRPLESYSEFSTSLKGLRALAFGRLPTEKHNITKSFGDGTELSLYRRGWVTLSGLPCGGSTPTIEPRQAVLDHIVQELWPDLNVRMPKAEQGKTAQGASLREEFILDWSHSANEDLIRQYLQGYNRTPKQLVDIRATWELKRGWNHGTTPDNSLYTKRILEEALWLQRIFGWTLQDVVDIVITFCKKNQLRWSFGRANKQIAEGQRYILSSSSQPHLVCTDDAATFVLHKKQPHTLTCNDSQIIRTAESLAEPMLTSSTINELAAALHAKSPDTFQPTNAADDRPKVSGGFKHKSTVRDAVLQAIRRHPSWVKTATIAAETHKSVEAIRKQLQRLRILELVDCDGKGRYRNHRERRLRKLKPCCLKPIPRCSCSEKERKTLSRSELSRRGWPEALINELLPEAGKDYVVRRVDLRDRIGSIVVAHFYFVSHIRAIERQPWFEVERARILRENRPPR